MKIYMSVPQSESVTSKNKPQNILPPAERKKGGGDKGDKNDDSKKSRSRGQGETNLIMTSAAVKRHPAKGIGLAE